MSKNKSSGEQVTPVSVLALATCCVEGLKPGLGEPVVRRGPEVVISDLEPPEEPQDPIGLQLYPLADICQEETSATNGVYSYFVGELQDVGQICALAVLRENFQASGWELERLSRVPSEFRTISQSRAYRDWDWAKLVEEDWGDFVLLGPEHAVLIAKAASCCLANDLEGRRLREEMVDRLKEAGANPPPALLWQLDRMLVPVEAATASNDSGKPCDDWKA